MAEYYSMFPLLLAAEKATSERKGLTGTGAAIGSFNVNFYAQSEGIAEGLHCAEAPGIIQASRGACSFQGGPDKIKEVVDETMKGIYALHLDHGNLESCVSCIDNGFSSVMIDASDLSEVENIAIVREVVKIAHARGVSVEAEYGLLSGVEEEIVHQKTVYADPLFVPAFFDRSGADALAIAYGTSHGPNKGNTDALDTSIIDRSYKGLSAHAMNLHRFLVSHGSSTVPEDLVKEINHYGGRLEGAKGVPIDMIRGPIIRYGIRKINIDTDLRLVITAETRKYISGFRDSLKKESEALARIIAILDGREKSMSGKKSQELTDPRDYLWTVQRDMPEFLSEDYRTLGDDRFAELMGAISIRISHHVAMLCREFGSAGLAEKVDSSLTLKEMAKKYASGDV